MIDNGHIAAKGLYNLVFFYMMPIKKRALSLTVNFVGKHGNKRQGLCYIVLGFEMPREDPEWINMSAWSLAM